ncbi:hypothetical protein PoB_000834400 [Plakobranchus ocellatus]|uniref:Uncharacterized protein n=1 Tax=Plakobranchus ocellatus TaxID=259542 RepID=A0AAV3YFS3_9GAST|nr:hypothetical protein PoB_000834400 [Plakobranchus ocellatus]
MVMIDGDDDDRDDCDDGDDDDNDNISNQVPLMECGLVLLDGARRQERYDEDAETAAVSARGVGSTVVSESALCLQEPFCRGFEPRYRRPGLAEGLKV